MRQDGIADNRRRPLTAEARTPQSEANVFLPVRPRQVIAQGAIDLACHGRRVVHTWTNSQWIWAIHAFALRPLAAHESCGRLQYCQPASPKIEEASLTPPCGSVLSALSGRREG